MSERTSSIYRLVTIPAFYSLFQNLLGTATARRRLVSELYDVQPGMRVLDVGCGPGDLLAYLPDVRYTGVDRNRKHIDSAIARYGDSGTFVCDDVANIAVDPETRYHRIIFSGLLHHLDDPTGSGLIVTCASLLSEGGRIVGHEPCHVEHPNRFARWMLDRDSGEHVRNKSEYEELFRAADGILQSVVVDDLIRIPYYHILLTWSQRKDTPMSETV